PVKRIAEAVPRGHFGKDLLNTFGAFMTICRVQRNNAEPRIAAMRANGWKPETIAAVTTPAVHDAADATEDTDLEVLHPPEPRRRLHPDGEAGPGGGTA